MRACAERVVGPLHEECVSTRASAKGNYLSVTLSVWVETPDQVGVEAGTAGRDGWVGGVCVGWVLGGGARREKLDVARPASARAWP
jgi:hypothetical protein